MAMGTQPPKVRSGIRLLEKNNFTDLISVRNDINIDNY